MRYIALVAAVCVLPLVHGQDRTYKDNVVVVVDASGSMGDRMSGTKDSKMVVAKHALKKILSQIGEDTNIGMLVFGSVREEWIYPLGPRDDQKLLKSIDSIGTGGGTPLGEYIKKGADRLLQQRSHQYGYGSYRLLVVTDGEAGDSGLVDSYTPDVISRGIVVDVIGVDMKQTHTLATKVHSYRSANDAAALEKAIQAVFAEVGASDDANVDADAFEDIKFLDENMAQAMIQALSESGNHPIDEIPQEGASVYIQGSVSLPSSGWGVGPYLLVGIVILAIISIGIMVKRSMEY